MVRWRSIVGLGTMFVALTVPAFPGEAPPKGPAPAAREGRAPGAARSPEDRAAVEKAVATWTARAIAGAAQLAPEKTGPFVEAYVAARSDLTKRMLEARESRDREKMMEVMRELRSPEGGTQKILEAHLTPEQADKVKGLTGFRGLEPSIRALVAAKVKDAKIEKALPVLVKHHQQMSEFLGRIRSQEVSREEANTKMQALREATVKELAATAGEDVAATWNRGGQMGFAGPRGGERGRGGQDNPRGEGRGGGGGGAPPGP